MRQAIDTEDHSCPRCMKTRKDTIAFDWIQPAAECGFVEFDALKRLAYSFIDRWIEEVRLTWGQHGDGTFGATEPRIPPVFRNTMYRGAPIAEQDRTDIQALYTFLRNYEKDGRIPSTTNRDRLRRICDEIELDLPRSKTRKNNPA